MQEVVIGKSLICRKEKNLLLLASVELRKEEMKKKKNQSERISCHCSQYLFFTPTLGKM